MKLTLEQKRVISNILDLVRSELITQEQAVKDGQHTQVRYLNNMRDFREFRAILKELTK